MNRRKKYICVPEHSPLPGTKGHRGHKNRVFEFLGQMPDEYRKAELKKVSDYWYVEFQFRYPESLRPHGKRYKRIRVTEELNVIRKREGDAAAEAYALNLVRQINLSLSRGYNPFESPEPEAHQQEALNLNSAIELFLTAKRRDLKKKTIQDYEGYLNVFKAYSSDLLRLPVTEITQDHLETYMTTAQDEREWSNRTYNNTKGLLFTLFEFLRKKKLIAINPAADIETQKTRPKAHTYYDRNLSREIKAHMSTNDPYMFEFCQFIYYSCLRPKSEARNLKMRDIDMDRRLIKVDGKTGPRYVPICAELYEYLKDIDAPPDYYLFGTSGPSTKQAGQNYFSERYKKVKLSLGIPPEYTIYSWKHTRCVDLVMSGMKDVEVMHITGHTDFTSFQKYLRDLGAAMSEKVYGKTVRF